MHAIHHLRRLPAAARLLAAAVLVLAVPAPVATAGAAAAAAQETFDLPEPLLAVARAMELRARDATDLSVQPVVVGGVRGEADEAVGAAPADPAGLAGDAERRFTVVLDGEPRTVVLRPHSLRAADCVAFVVGADGVQVPVPLPAPRTWRGTVAEVPTMAAAATIHADGRVTALLHDPTGDTWAVEPMTADVPGLPAAVHAVYRPEDIRPDGSRCGVTAGLDMLRRQPARGEPGFVDPLELRAHRVDLGAGHAEAAESSFGGLDSSAQIAFDADYEYYLLNGSDEDATIADIDTVMNAVGIIYGEQAGICYETTGYIVRTTPNDPYVVTDPVDAIFEFLDEWEANVTIPRDIAHLFTGRNLDGSVIGIAFLGAFCSDFGYGISQSRYTSNFTNRTQLTAHELGHNWDACHCNTSGCTGGAPDSDCGIMNSFVNGSLGFGQRSLTAMEIHRITRPCLSSCSGPVYVDAANTGFENGSEQNPWDTFDEGHDTVAPGGTVLIRDGTYVETGLFFRQLLLELDGGGSAIIGD